MTPPETAPDLLHGEREEDRLQALIALARSRDPQSLPIIRDLARSDPAPKVRYAARKLLDLLEPAPPAPQGAPDLDAPDVQARVEAVATIVRSGDRSELSRLKARLAVESEAQVLASLVKAIGVLGGAPELPLLGNFLRDADARIRANAVEALAATRQGVAYALVVAALQDHDHRVRANAAVALQGIGTANTLRVLEGMAASGQLWMRDAAAYALGAVKDPAAQPLLAKLLTDPSAPVRAKAQAGLEHLAAQGDQAAARLLSGLSHPEKKEATPEDVQAVVEDRPATADPDGLASENPKLRMNIVNTIVTERDLAALPRLVARLQQEENEFVLSRILAAIGILGSDDASTYGPILGKYLDDPDARVVANTIDALVRIGSRGDRQRVQELLAHPEPRVQASAIRYLAQDLAFDPRGPVEEMLASTDAHRQLAGLHLVSALGRPELADSVRLAAGSAQTEVRECARKTAQDLERRGWPGAHALVAEMASGPISRGEVLSNRKPAAIKRLWAFLADSIGLGVAFGILGVSVAWLTDPSVLYSVDDVSRRLHSQSNAAIVSLIYSVIFFVRDGFRGGRGFAKRHLGLRVVDLETRTGCGLVKSMLRQATLFLPPLTAIEPILVVVAPDGRRLADRLLGTAVIDETGRDLSPLDRGFLWVVGTLALLAAVGALLFVAYVHWFRRGGRE